MAAKATAENETTLKVGAKAPAFGLKDAKGDTVKLSDFKGQKVVLYFYPKDDTPGCTKEACGFRDEFAQLKKRSVVVLGISTDSQKAHQKFTDKYLLPFTLLSDPEHEVIEKYGAWVEKSLYGRKYMGIARITYIIDEAGKIAHAFPKVKPDSHAAEVIAAIDAMS
jgi:peroxiredoxin Q/BCP